MGCFVENKMEQSPYYNGENSDFEDDVVEVDFEEQYEKEEEEKKVQSTEDGVFGVNPTSELSDEDLGEDIEK